MTRPAPARVRVPDWPERLAAILEARSEVPFGWGSQDCCSFAADVALELAGIDPIAEQRGRYTDEASAAALIGPEGLEAFVAERMAATGCPESNRAFAARGDWALVEVGNQVMVGIIVGDRIAVPGLDRLQYVAARMAIRTWSI